MRFALAWMVLAALIAPGQAQSRPSTTDMTCAEAGGLIAARGLVVLSTGPLTYDRFVAHAGQCLLGEVAEPVWVSTRDVPQCLVGRVCRIRPTRTR